MKRAALTFDDGPNGRYTLQILKTLKEHGIRACFFLLGKNIERSPEIAKKIKREGHLIGNHTYSHPHIKKISPSQALHQIEEAEKIFRDTLHLKPRFFRPPYGEYTPGVKRLVGKKGYKLILWDCCADDWKNPSPEAIVKRIISQIKNNSIILLHDGANIRIGESRANTVKALPILIRVLTDKGFKFVRLDKLSEKWDVQA